MKPIVIVGSINMDLVSRTERIPRPGETVLGSEFQLHSGGKGANQAVAVARLGHQSILLGALGDDIFGHQLLSTLNDFGVDTRYIASAPGCSGTASIVVDAGGENTIIVTPGANLLVTPDYLQTKLDVLRSAGMVLAQLEIPIDTVAWLAEHCTEFGVPFILDPAPATRLPPTLFSHVTWFTPNSTEALFYSAPGESTEQMLARFFDLGIRNVILKRGSEGAILAGADGSRHQIDAFHVNPIDTTAAGDALNGAFAVAILRGLTPSQCVQFAAAAAAISVTKLGAQASMPSQEEVATLLKNCLERHSPDDIPA